MTNDNISKITTSLDSTKKSSSVIPTRIVKLVNKGIWKDLPNFINGCTETNEFPKELKAADIAPIFKKEDLLKKENYWPVSVLLTISEIFK